MPFELRSKIWLENNRQKVFGDGPCKLLQLVEQKGSLRQAAGAMQMSYHQAWELVNMLEDNLGFALLQRQAGGPSGGGSTLTEEARELLRRYLVFRREADASLRELFGRHFKG